MEHNATAYYNKYDGLIQLLREAGFDNGITSYMSEMEYKKMTNDFNDFYKDLKRLRFLRNKLVNDSEQSFLDECLEEDYATLERTFDDVTKQRDPIALLRREMERIAKKKKEEEERLEQERLEQEQAEKDRLLREEILAKQKEKEEEEERKRQSKPDITTFFAIFCILFVIVLFVLLAHAIKLF